MTTEELRRLKEMLWQYSVDYDSSEAGGVTSARTSVTRRLAKQERRDAKE